ncbi:hypothetical protein GCM10009801_73320 [Streptomyces albiaxialis]|uniref:Uncharacterized protein n=1 Tax=Streptomyces albiaxialis TaxID=329523 RepID=A0ABP5IIJ7_9ACTN
MTDRKFVFLAGASVKVTMQARTEEAARAAYAEIRGETFAVEHTTGDGHGIDSLELEGFEPELEEDTDTDNGQITLLAEASVLVCIRARTEEAARTAYETIHGQRFGIDSTTRDGHCLDDLDLEQAHPELYEVDDEEPVTDCPAQGCPGYLVADRCTSADHPA